MNILTTLAISIISAIVITLCINMAEKLIREEVSCKHPLNTKQ